MRKLPSPLLKAMLVICLLSRALHAQVPPPLAGAKGTVIIHVPIRADVGLPGYSWWDVPVSATSAVPGVRAARHAYERALKKQRFYY